MEKVSKLEISTDNYRSSVYKIGADSDFFTIQKNNIKNLLKEKINQLKGRNRFEDLFKKEEFKNRQQN
ncbi:hypothetical protein M0R36_11345 [bacterium]|jgi:hypothetical protein|nr:hypothetical protein [bacterium]